MKTPLTPVAPQVMSFGHFQLDVGGRRLLHRGIVLGQLQPKVFELLVYLAQRADTVVSKDELAAAVWHDEPVGDDVIARVVMKLRQALGESARAPHHLRTHPGVGYSLVSRPTSAQGEREVLGLPEPSADSPSSAQASLQSHRWLILPTIDRNDRPDTKWAEAGLPRVLAHLLQMSSEHPQAECEDPNTEWGSDRGESTGRVIRALSGPDSRWVCAAEFCETADGYHLALSWGRTAEGVLTVSLAGDNLLVLVRALAVHLAPTDGWSRRLTTEHLHTYAVLIEAMAHPELGPATHAQDTLEACFQALPDWPELALLRAEEMRRLNANERSHAAALRAMAHCERDPEVQRRHGCHALRRLADAMFELGLLSELRPLLEQTLTSPQAAPQHPWELVHWSRLWTLLGIAYEESTEFEQARLAFLQGVNYARRAGRTEDELWSRIRMGRVEMIMGRLHSASEQFQRVRSAATEQDLRPLVVASINNLLSIELCLGSYRAALALAERALALSYGMHPSLWANASFRLLSALIYLKHYDHADRILCMRERRLFQNLIVLSTNDVMRARLAWRLGRWEDSRRHFEAAVHILDGGHVPKLRCLTALELVSLLCLMGRIEEAQALWDQQPLTSNPGRATVAQAAGARPRSEPGSSKASPHLNLPVASNTTLADLAMARGDRPRAKGLLTEALEHVALGMPEAIKLLLNLAWLHVEDGELEMAEDLLARLSSVDRDFPPLQWLHLALNAGYGQSLQKDWNALRANTPAMLKLCPWAGTAQDVQQRVMGQPRPLPIMLWWATW